MAGDTGAETIDLFRGWKVRRVRLSNGLTLLVLPDPTTPLVSYHTWYRVGSRNERPGKTGLAHLFEHLMFGATSNHPSGEFDRELERMGAETNAATWLDWTYYHETFPPEALDLVLDFESDRMSNLVLTEEVVAREKSVVANERRYRVEDRVDGFLDELLYSTAFSVHTYGHPTIGWMEDIEGFTLEDCLGFYGTYYSPGNAIIVIVGDLDGEAIVGRIAGRLGSLAPHEVPALEAGCEPPQGVERRVAVSREMPAAKLLVGYHIPGIGDATNAAIVVLNTILCGGESGRLVRRLIHDEEVAADFSGWAGVFADPCLLEFQVDLRAGREPEEALAIIDEELAGVVEGGVEESEIATARNRNKLAFYMGLGTASGKANQLGFFETVIGDCGALVTRLRDIDGVGRSGVLEAARATFDPHNRTVILATPETR
jgi:zinc protease